MILVSRSIRYVRIFAGVLWRGVNCTDSNGRGLRPVNCSICITYLRPIYVTCHTYSCLLACFRRSSVVSINRLEYTLLGEFEWRQRNVSYLSAKWAQKCQTFYSTIRPSLQWNRWSIIHNSKHIIGLHSIYYVQFQHFLMVADNVSWIMNLKAINRYIEHHYFAMICDII